MHVTLESNFNMICIPEGFFTSIGDNIFYCKNNLCEFTTHTHKNKKLFYALLDYRILLGITRTKTPTHKGSARKLSQENYYKKIITRKLSQENYYKKIITRKGCT